MSNIVLVGPADNGKVPYQPLGVIFYEQIKKNDPDAIIMIDDGTGDEVTYGQLFNLSIKLATGLRSLGVKKGDVITIVSQNNWRYIITIIAGFYIGATVNLLNHDYTPGELKHFLSICHPVLIFCTSKSCRNILKLKQTPYYPQNVIMYDADSTGEVQNFDTLLVASDKNFTLEEVDPKEDVALIFTSSGSTGLPKCVMMTHANFRPFISCAGDPKFINLNPEERTIAFLPLFHIIGSGVTLATIYFGTKFVIMDKFVPDKFLTIIQEHQITKLFTVPPILLFLVKSPLVSSDDISSVKDIICAGALVKRELVELVEKKLKIKTVRQMYGMTETCGPVTLMPNGIKRHGSVGQVATNFKIKVCDVDTGAILPPNRVGELRMFGEGLMKGYLRNDYETKNAFDDEGFIKSGDLGYYDEDGFFYIVDRLKDIIKYKGFQVSPAELETLLLELPGVKDAGVIGVLDERAGEVPLAFVVKQPDSTLTEEDIFRFIEENLSVQKRLYGGVRFVEEIPKNPSGKILRRKLKELL